MQQLAWQLHPEVRLQPDACVTSSFTGWMHPSMSSTNSAWPVDLLTVWTVLYTSVSRSILYSSLCNCLKGASTLCWQSSAGNSILDTQLLWMLAHCWAVSVDSLKMRNLQPRHLHDLVHTITIFQCLMKTYLFTELTFGNFRYWHTI